MSVKGLFEIVGIEEPSEFTYFENLADLLETDEYIEDVAKEKLGLIKQNEILFKAAN